LSSKVFAGSMVLHFFIVPLLPNGRRGANNRAAQSGDS
jgi:hypothetical protein